MPMAREAISPRSGAVLPASLQFKAGTIPNPAGRPAAGSVVLEWFNAMAGWSQNEYRRVLADETAPGAKRAAARNWLDASTMDRSKSGAPIAGPELDRILDRTIGKAEQRMTITQMEDPSATAVRQLALDELRRIAAGEIDVTSALSRTSERTLRDGTDKAG